MIKIIRRTENKRQFEKESWQTYRAKTNKDLQHSKSARVSIGILTKR